LKEELKHLVRIADADLTGNKQVFIALTGIKGVGMKISKIIAKKAGVDPYTKLGLLPDDTIEELKEGVAQFGSSAPSWLLNRRKDYYTGEDKHLIGSEIDLTFREDINRLRKIRSYRGIRHERGHKVRGQRTKSTGRRGVVVGVRRKKR
jgi:small subunit ribosomal protein S13